MATSTDAIMLEMEREGIPWIKSEIYQKRKAREQKELEKNNPMKQCVLKYDHFENIHRLSKELAVFEGAPNFRQVPGYLVFGTGQPTKSGFKLSLEHILEQTQAQKVLWTSMRQEPVVYMNGQSFTPRLLERMNENMEFPNATPEFIEWLQEVFVNVIREQVQNSKNDRKVLKEDQGKVSYFRDTYAEHPEDRENIEYRVNLENDTSLVTLSGLYEQLKEHGFNLAYARLPIVDEKAPREVDFDTILVELKHEPLDTACVFNCQMGKGRTTTGMVLACLVKDVLHGDSQKSYPKEEPVNPSKFEDEDEAMNETARRGQFKVLEKIYKYIPEVKEAKAHLDHIIDLCGEPPKGTGLQNLRECIIWTKDKYDFEPKVKKPFWKQMSVNFIERYCYLIMFTTYVKSEAARDFPWTFVQWMDQRAEIREIINHGKKSFAWK
eukprot:maker-scaffold534_size144770-snap-gene-0.28 protein:Tk11137 transcript:maker-scaffold534_size144770-snap-gene-0.28-mRNA-1 annotation:"hypothetical protein EUTSA_v10005753mg"